MILVFNTSFVILKLGRRHGPNDYNASETEASNAGVVSGSECPCRSLTTFPFHCNMEAASVRAHLVPWGPPLLPWGKTPSTLGTTPRTLGTTSSTLGTTPSTLCRAGRRGIDRPAQSGIPSRPHRSVSAGCPALVTSGAPLVSAKGRSGTVSTKVGV